MINKRIKTRNAVQRAGPAASARTSSKSHCSLAMAASEALPLVKTRSGRALILRTRLAMDRETFARLVPMSTRNLANIEAGKVPSATVLRQFKALRRVIDALGEVIQKDVIGPWLEQPNEAFGGLKPIEVIERGEVDRIWEMIYFLRSGSPA
jgi:hypothetical protein